jgi:hypothetical protein
MLNPLDAASAGVVREKYFNTDGFVTPNSLFRHDISDGIHRLFHDRDKQYGFIKPNARNETPFYLVERERVLLKLGQLGQLQSNFGMLGQTSSNQLLKQEIIEGTKENTDLTQARRIVDELVDLDQVTIFPTMAAELKFRNKKN